MIVRETTPQENRRADELFCIAFELPMESQPSEVEEPGIHRWAAFEEPSGEMMSCFVISDHQIQFDGHSCKMGGIGGVASLPQYRRQGGIRGCFEASLPHMYTQGYDFSYLYPFSTAYYRKFGYECCVRTLDTSVNLSLMHKRNAAGFCRLAEAAHPLTEEIRFLDALWESRYNMSVLHTSSDYDWTRKPNPAVSQNFTYVWFRESGTPGAYMTFHKADQCDGRNLVCSRFCFLDAAGLDGLLELLRSLASDHTYAKLTLPFEPSTAFQLPEWSMGAMEMKILNAGMVRVINAESVLKKARCSGTGSVVLQLHDPQIPSNNGCFRIVFAPGQENTVERCSDAADAVMEISAFSSLLSGTMDFPDAVRWLPGVELRTAAPELDGLFYRKPMMICDSF